LNNEDGFHNLQLYKAFKKAVFRTPIKNPEVVWLKPQFNCEVKFLELDFTGEMRHASFKGLI